MRAQVEGETKVSKLPKLDATLGSETPGGPGQTKELEQLENLRQMFVAMTDDYRIICVEIKLQAPHAIDATLYSRLS